VKKKLSLSKTETQEYDTNVKRLVAAGVVPPEEKPSAGSQMLTVEQIGGPTVSFVHAPPVGGFGIVVWLRFVPLKSQISLCDFQIRPERWNDTKIFLVDAAEGVLPYRALGGVEYPKTDVLNPWIASDRCLKHGHVLEGVLIAQSFASLPAWCQSGISIDMELCFFDQFDNIYPLEVELMVIRDKRDERPRRSTGLFGPAVNASVRGTYGEKPDLGGREGISPKEPSVPRPNGSIPKYQRFI
jgi:hypothetical protein